MFIPAPEGTVRCVQNFTVQGEECLNVFHVLVSASPSPADLLDLSNELFTAWSTTLLANQADEVTFNAVQCTDVEVESGLQATSTEAPVAGGSANPAASNSLAMLLSLRTPYSGRSNRGRLFIPGWRQDQIDTDSSYWTVATTGEASTDAAAWLAAVEGITLGAKTVQLVVTSYYTLDPDAVPPEPRTVPRDLAINQGVESIVARRRIATQRRRRPRS